MKIITYFHSRNDDVIFLQETHSSVDQEKLWANQWGGKVFFLSSFATNSRGSAILLKPSLNVDVESVICDNEGRFIILVASVEDHRLIFLKTYMPQIKIIQISFWGKKNKNIYIFRRSVCYSPRGRGRPEFN